MPVRPASRPLTGEDVNDQGASSWFELTTPQRAGAESRLRDMGVSTDLLVPLT